MPENCLCGSELPYSACCQLYHQGTKTAPTALILMRSRFTAYAMQDSAYLLKTWDKNKRPNNIDFSKDEAEWQKLEIVTVKKGAEKDSKGVVEFKAYFQIDGEQRIMTEISRFKKINGNWFYLDGLVKSIAEANQSSNQGKNTPCACGSGKKFKRCCGKQDQ